MSEKNEWRNYTPGQWRQLASSQADEIERLNRLIDSRDKRIQQLLRWRKESKLREAERRRLLHGPHLHDIQ